MLARDWGGCVWLWFVLYSGRSVQACVVYVAYMCNANIFAHAVLPANMSVIHVGGKSIRFVQTHTQFWPQWFWGRISPRTTRPTYQVCGVCSPELSEVSWCALLKIYARSLSLSVLVRTCNGFYAASLSFGTNAYALGIHSLLGCCMAQIQRLLMAICVCVNK